VEVDRPTAETEPFLGHPAVQNCARLAVFDPAADFGWTELVDWLHRPLRLLRKGGVEEVGGSFESDQFQQVTRQIINKSI
jgi:hypothetical protein